MKKGDIVELLEDITFYRKGRRATFIRSERANDRNAEIRWLGDDNSYGDVEIVPKRLLKTLN